MLSRLKVKPSLSICGSVVPGGLNDDVVEDLRPMGVFSIQLPGGSHGLVGGISCSNHGVLVECYRIFCALLLEFAMYKPEVLEYAKTPKLPIG